MDPNSKSNSNANANANTNTNSKYIPIPNALTITIHTSVPGYQTIKYKPDMTIKSIDKDEKTIWFDPLVPLDQSVINKVPESIRIMEFFNKGLFESLINSHGNKKQITLDQAKKNKIIDNNIQITLNNLFPTNGILYIKGESYAIADLQWTRSDWKIDRKIKEIPQIDVNKISDPLTYSNVVKNEVLLANNQLEQLPKDLLYGSNFNKETEELSSIDREKELINKKRLEDERLKSIEDKTPKPPKQQLAIEDQTPKPPKPTLTIEDQTPKPPKPTLVIEDQTPKPPKPPLALGDGKNKVSPQIINPPGLVEDIQNIQMTQEFLPPLTKSQESTKILRSYFGDDIFYSMINMIFRYMTEEQKIFIQNIFKNTTNIDVKGISSNISKAAYNFTITGTKTITSSGVSVKKPFTDGLKVISNSGGGNCLFLSVADAINYHNYNSSDIGNKILYSTYGNGDRLFTTKVLRNIVSTEIINQFNSDEIFRKNSIEEGRMNLHILNDIFEGIITSQDSMLVSDHDAYYNSTLLDTYRSNDNFFVIIPNDIQSQNRNRPFKLVENNYEIKNYIESPYYWGDQKTIDIINKILQLNIITIKNENDKFTIPYPTVKNDDNNMWNKYLFLYNTENHYELITFEYLVKKLGKPARLKKTIFNRRDNIIPPFYIIFFIFSVFFVKLIPIDKEKVVLFSNFLYAIQNSFNNIIQTPISTDKNIDIFIANFQKYFGPINREILGEIHGEIHGGALTNTIGSSKFLKKEEKQDNIQISFHITIDMELQKGTTLTKEQISNIKCTKGWNKVRKSFAEFTGRKYVIPPVYENLSDKYNKKEEPNKKEEVNNNNTKKNTTGGGSRGKRRRKTIKNYITK